MGTWWHRETYLATFSATLLTQLHPTLLTQVHPLLLSFPQRTGSRAWWVFATLGASSAALHLSLFSPKLVFLTIIVVGGGQMLKVEADLEKETHGVTVAKDSWKRNYHFFIGNRKAPEATALPEAVRRAKPLNLFWPCVLQRSLCCKTVDSFDEVLKNATRGGGVWLAVWPNSEKVAEIRGQGCHSPRLSSGSQS
ncbi:uncharacterized protein [Gorilla gorilla gorilla]|uniref:uncharacterized protein n=1 Tax=Gorilla gorilla gorilla TaxID=9595 RepID=UPI00300B4917